MNKPHLSKIITIVIVILLGLLSFRKIATIRQNIESKKTEASNIAIKEKAVLSNDSIAIDMNGDGKLELLSAQSSTGSSQFVLFDKNGSVLGASQSWKSNTPNKSNMSAFKSDISKKEEFALIQHYGGSNMDSAIVLKFVQNKIVQVCHNESIIVVGDCAYYQWAPGKLEVKDLDGDGMVEIVSYIYQFPRYPDLDYIKNVGNPIDREDYLMATETYSYNGYEFILQKGGVTLLKKPDLLSNINKVDDTKVYHAKVMEIADNGVAKFKWYDTELEKIYEPNNSSMWFYASPSGMLNDTERIDKWVDYIRENKKSVFLLEGNKVEDGCTNFAPDNCNETFKIYSVEVVNTNKNMRF